MGKADVFPFPSSYKRYTWLEKYPQAFLHSPHALYQSWLRLSKSTRLLPRRQRRLPGLVTTARETHDSPLSVCWMSPAIQGRPRAHAKGLSVLLVQPHIFDFFRGDILHRHSCWINWASTATRTQAWLDQLKFSLTTGKLASLIIL